MKNNKNFLLGGKRKKELLPLPSTIAFVITARCNLHCKMCFQYGERAQKLGIKGNALLGNPKELTLEELKIIIGKINKYYPFDKKPNFFITGGEPFERRDMVDIIQYAASQGNRVVVNTNFSFIDEGTAEKLIEIENFAPLVSIDGPERIHDKIRGVNGTYKRAMKNVRFFSGRGKRVEVCTTITKYNVDYLVELYKELKGLKVYWYLKHVAWMPEKYVELQRKLSKRYFNVDFIVYLPEKVAVPANKIKVLEAQIDKIRKLKKEYGIGFEEAARPAGTSLFEHHCTFNCKQKNKICRGPEVNILPDGDVSFCNGAAYGLGPIYANVLHDELPEILTKKKPLEEVYNRLLKKGEVFPVCVKCSYLVNEDQLGIFEKLKRQFRRIGKTLGVNSEDTFFPQLFKSGELIMPDISVLIPTYKRTDRAFECIKAILKNDFKAFEIIIVEQEGKGELEERLKTFREGRISYFNLKNRGASRAKNFGIKKAKGEIIAFTDDDCLPDRNWLGVIDESFQKHKEIVAVFGKVLPYQPEEHKGLASPCSFEEEKERIITAPCRHWQEIGFGNNMAFRKKIFEKTGGFKKWLGPGSIGLAAEDAEICYRILRKDYKILYSPKVLVYHNRWLKKVSKEWEKQMRSYCCGKLAAYGFYAFQGDKLGKEVVGKHMKSTFQHVYSQTKKAIKNLSFKTFWNIFLDIYYDLRGLLVAFWFAKIARIPK